jgi:hypothetical protein
MIVLGVTELLADQVRRGRGDRLVELEDELIFWIVLMLADEATARQLRR